MHIVFRSLAAFAVVTLPPLAAQNSMWVNRQQSVAVPSSAWCGTAIVYDEARAETLLIATLQCNTQFTWDGATWSQPATSGLLPVRPVQAVYDSVRQRVVAVVGTHSTGLETWEWDGVVWSLRIQGGFPARRDFELVFDRTRNVTLLFGGNAGGSPGYADLWQWDGQTWTLLYIGGPTPRWNTAMAYDEQRQTVLLFGGWGEWQNNQAQELGDTWEWNGSYWQLHFGIPSPSPRRWASLAYDSDRGCCVLYGGYTSSGAVQDTWEWNGTAWTDLQIPGGGNGTGISNLAYDRDRGVMVGWDASQNETWEYVAGPGVQASFATFGSGCAGPAGVVTLDSAPGSLPRIGTVFQLQLLGLPTSAFNVPIGFFGFDASNWNGVPLPVSLAPLGFPGCQAWIAPAAGAALAYSGSGSASWPVPIPMNAFVLGVDLYFQGGVLVPGWNPGGFVFTNAGHAVVGNL
jgi:hypothetical protein